MDEKSDFCPHSSSGPPGHLPPGGRDELGSWAELLAVAGNRVLVEGEGRLYERYDVVCEEGKP